MAILIVPASLACADYKSTVRNSAVVTFQFLFGNKMYCGIVFIKVVRHSLDLILNSCKISAFFSYYETLSGMFLSCSKLRILSASYCFQSRLNWDGVLFAILYSFDVKFEGQNVVRLTDPAQQNIGGSANTVGPALLQMPVIIIPL